jgi:hypothetical protein
MGIAEQMGRVLQRTSISVNIKERLDFSCALFGPDGSLVANAPHLPVHLGAMSEAVRFQVGFLWGNLGGGAHWVGLGRKALTSAERQPHWRPTKNLQHRQRFVTTARAARARPRACGRATCCSPTTRSWRGGRISRTSRS